MNRFPTNYEAYMAYQRAYAGQDCGWNPICHLQNAVQGADKFVKDSLGGAANQVVQNNAAEVERLKQASNDLQTRVNKGVDKTNKDSEAAAHISYNLQNLGAQTGNNLVNLPGQIGTGFDQIKNSLLGESNAVQDFLKNNKMVMVIGGVAVIGIVLLVMLKK